MSKLSDTKETTKNTCDVVHRKVNTKEPLSPTSKEAHKKTQPCSR